MPEHVIYRVARYMSPSIMPAWSSRSCATHHLIQERGQVKVGDDVVIVGPGPMGIMAMQYAKTLRRAARDPDRPARATRMRLAIGRQVGADVTLYSEEDPGEAVMELTGGKGAEFVLECSASEQGVQHAIDCARKAYEGPGGKGVVVFISLWGQKITLQPRPGQPGSARHSRLLELERRETWEHAVDLLTRGVFDLDPMITNHYALEEWEPAFANLRAKEDVKAFVHPNGRGWAR